MDADLEEWIFAHSYLAPMAAFHEEVGAALGGLAAPAVAPPPFDDYAPEYARGVPLLASGAAPLDLAPAAALLEGLVAALAKGDVPPKLAADLREILGPGGMGERAFAVVAWVA